MTWAPFEFTPPVGDATSIASQATGTLKTMVAHPFVAGMGEGKGHYKYLSFPNAVQALSAELATETQAVFGLAVASSSYGGFAAQLQALTSVFPIKQFDQVKTRAEKLAVLENSKFDLPGGPGNLSAGSVNLSSLPMMAQLKKAALVENALAGSGLFESSDPLSNLEDFQSEKVTTDAEVAGALDDAKSALTGGGGFRFYAESDAAATIKNGLSHDYTLTAIMLFIGSPAELALLQEIAP